MSKINDGGPAFPVHPNMDNEYLQGMSLRDWFAGMALIPLRDQIGGENEEIAKYAYEIADAMLAEREVH